MKKFTIVLLSTILVPLLLSVNLSAEQREIKKEHRLALLIGNSNYIHGGSLKNSVTDVRAMKGALEDLGFTVLKYENCTQKTMKRAMDNFGIKLKGQDVGLFFYSGHGVQVNGHNYLIPTNAKLHNENDTEYDCVRADRVLAKMESAGTKTSIVILDACRDNPFERSWRKGTKGTGLAFMNAPSGSLIAYSTAPGKTALDGGGNHSPYTSALLQHIGTANITVLEMFQGVRSTVMARTEGKQTPWESTSLRGNFYFNDERGIAAMTHPKQEGAEPAGKSSSEDIDLLLQMAMLKEKANDIEGAVNTYKRIIEIWPGNEEATEGYIRLRLKITQDDATPPHPLKKMTKLFIKTEPEKSRVRILNIKPRFYQGMDLKPGKYHIEVSSNGYSTKKIWATLGTGEIKTIQISINKTARDKPLSKSEEQAMDFFSRAKALYDSDPQKVLILVNRAIDLNPKFSEAYTLRAHTHMKLQQFSEAYQDYNRAINLAPKANYNNYFGRAAMSYNLGEFQNAIDDLNKVLIIGKNISDKASRDRVLSMVFGARGLALLGLRLEDRGCADVKKACDLGWCKSLGQAKEAEWCLSATEKAIMLMKK